MDASIISAASFMNHQNKMILGGTRGHVELWSIERQSCERQLFEHPTSGISAVCITSTDKWLMVATLDGFLYQLNIDKGNLTKLRITKAKLLALDATDEHFILGATDSIAYLDDKELIGHTHWVSGVGFWMNIAVTASFDRTIRTWDMKTGNPLLTMEGHTAEINSFTLVGAYAVSGSPDKTLRVWYVMDGTNLFTYPLHTNPIVAGKPFVFAAAVNKEIRFWNLCTGKPIETKHISSKCYKLVLSPTHTMAISLRGQGVVLQMN